MQTDRQKIVARLKKYSEKDSKTRCRNWVGLLTKDGYGRVTANSKSCRAHRVAYETYIGKIPEGVQVHHTCANRKCINVNHLQLVTNVENSVEMMQRQYYIKRIEYLEEKLAKYESN